MCCRKWKISRMKAAPGWVDIVNCVFAKVGQLAKMKCKTSIQGPCMGWDFHQKSHYIEFWWNYRLILLCQRYTSPFSPWSLPCFPTTTTGFTRMMIQSIKIKFQNMPFIRCCEVLMLFTVIQKHLWKFIWNSPAFLVLPYFMKKI